MIPAYALYRRSRAHQDLSVEEQREAVRSWSKERGYRIVREFADDASGLDTDRRREFQALLQVCSNPRLREAEVVLCYDVSRFSRLDPDEAAFHEYGLKRAGVRVVYTHEPGANEDGLTGHLVKSLKRVLAHEYSLKLSQVVQRGLRAHAQLGHWTGGPPPYGYRRAVRQADGTIHLLERGRWKAKGETILLVPDPVEARVVCEQIYETYVGRGLGIAAIAHRLNAGHVPAPSALRRRGVSAWCKGTVWAILRNPIYRGRLVYAKSRYSEVGKKRGKVRRPEADRIVFEDGAPAIVPAVLWEHAQAKHGTRRFATGRPWHRPYLLSSLIECGNCGKRFQAQTQVRGKVPAYYLCGGYIASGVAVCDAPRIPTAYLEDAVLEGIANRLDRVLDRAEIRKRIEELLRGEAPPEAALGDFEARLRETRRKIDRLVEALAAGTDDLPSVRAGLARLEREREGLEREVQAARDRAVWVHSKDLAALADRLIDALGEFREVLKAGEPEERKAVVRTFLQGIRIEKKTRQAILRWYRLPRASFVKLVELRGLEPLTPRLPALCSPN